MAEICEWKFLPCVYHKKHPLTKSKGGNVLSSEILHVLTLNKLDKTTAENCSLFSPFFTKQTRMVLIFCLGCTSKRDKISLRSYGGCSREINLEK